MNSSLPFRLLFLALAGLWGGTLYRLSALWSAYPNYLYGYSVPLLCLMIFRERWLSRPTPVVPVFSGMGWLLSLIGLTGWGMSRLAFEVMPTWRLAAWGMTLSLICITLGVVYSIGGRAWVRHFILPVGFLLLAVPWPMSLEQPIIAKASSWVTSITMSILTLATVPAIRHGNLIEISTGVVGIDEACSGIRSLQGTLMVSLFLGEIFRLTTARRGLLLATGLASALLLNILRTTSLVWWGDVNGVAALARFHDQAGFGVLGANLIVLAVVSWRWRSSLGLGAVAGPIPPVTANPRLTVPFSYSLTMVVLLVLVLY
ncbi:MAG: exosortase/archaeosortase family protein [Mariniphaga sp.]